MKATVIGLATVALIIGSQPTDGQPSDRLFFEAIALEEVANGARDVSFEFQTLAAPFAEDEEFPGLTSPFNAAAAAKYCAKYKIRALLTPELAKEFDTVAGNLAYDTVAEAADAAELAAEIANLVNDLETAGIAVKMAKYYFELAETFGAEVRSGEKKQAGQRMLRAMSAVARAERSLKRLIR